MTYFPLADLVAGDIHDEVEKLLESNVDKHNRKQTSTLLLQQRYVIREAVRTQSQEDRFDGIER